jgi:hypothetical protein
VQRSKDTRYDAGRPLNAAAYRGIKSRCDQIDLPCGELPIGTNCWIAREKGGQQWE